MKHGILHEVRTLVLSAALLALPLAACGGDAGSEKGGEKGKAATAADTGAGAQKGAAPAAPAPKFAFGNAAAEATQCHQRRQARLDSAASALQADSAAKRPGAGKNPIFAKEQKWYPQPPEFRDGSILPCNRIIVYYGNPASKRMGALGEFPRDEMLSRLRRQADQWSQADPGTPTARDEAVGVRLDARQVGQEVEREDEDDEHAEERAEIN